MKKRVIKLMCFLFSASLIWGLGGQYVRAAEVTELPEVAAQEAVKNNEDDFVIKNGVLKQYKGSDEVVYVPEGVQVIGKYAFRDVRSIREIHFPDTVTEIGEGAFYFCLKLESIDIPDSVTFIGERAFAECRELKTINLSHSITSIEGRTFFGCESLEQIDIPEGVTIIGDKSFYECYALQDIILPSGLEEIGDDAFNHTFNFTKITIPSTVKKIGDRAFYSSSIEKVVLPEGLRIIPDSAFANTHLKNVYIPNGVERIEKDAFYLSHLEEIVIEGTPEINADAFIPRASLKIVFLKDKLDMSELNGLNKWNVIIYGYPNSNAEKYAKKYGLKFKSLGQIEEQEIEINAGDNVKLTLSKEPGSPIKRWKSYDESVAIVLKDGTIVGWSEGTTKVFALGENGVAYLCCTVTVKDVPIKEPNEYTDEEKVKSLETSILLAKSKIDKESLKQLIWNDYYAHGEESIEVLETWGITMDQIMAMVDKVYGE